MANPKYIVKKRREKEYYDEFINTNAGSFWYFISANYISYRAKRILCKV
jgi:hypothetical protein